MDKININQLQLTNQSKINPMKNLTKSLKNKIKTFIK